jgi:entericidin A
MFVIFKEKPMKPMFAVLIAVALTLAGCNTMEGFGQDVKKAGDSIEKAGSKAGN